MTDAARLIVCAADGEPLVQTGRQAAARFAEALVRAARARAAGPSSGAGRRLVVAIERRAADARAALALLLHTDELLVVDDVAGCGEAAFLRACLGAADRDAQVIHAADLVASNDTRLITVAGAVAAPGVRLVAASATIDDVVAGAGGAICGPAWVALRSTLALLPPLDRDVRVGDMAGLRAVIVAPGASTLARRARGDLRAPDPTTPLGVDRACLGVFDANRAAAAEASFSTPLSFDLVSRRLGFVPDSLAWPALDPHALPA